MTLPYNLQWAQQDLDRALTKNSAVEIRSGLQEVLTQLTWGVDVSPLLPVIIQASETHDIPCKRIVYTIMTSIAHKDPDTSILITNTLLKDCASDNPIVRGLSLRAICDIPITTITDDLPKIISLGLADTNSYVRRMAVLATVHLSNQAITSKGITNRLYDLLKDRDPQIISNSLFSLSKILGQDFELNNQLIYHLVNTLPKFSEFAQAETLSVVSKYRPETDKERLDLMNIVDTFLTTTSPSVLISATQFLIFLTENDQKIQKQVISRVLNKYVTHLTVAGEEIKFSLLKHLKVLAERFPEVFSKHLPYFFVGFSDSSYVAKAKFEILKVVTDEIYVRDVIETSVRFILLEKRHTLKEGIELLRSLALRLDGAVGLVIAKMRLMVEMKRFNLINEILIVLPDLMRKLGGKWMGELMALLPAEFMGLSEKAIEGYVWIIGEFSGSGDSVYRMEQIILRRWEGSGIKLAVLTALGKMFYVSPGEVKKVLAQAISRGLKDEDERVRERSIFILRLLKNNLSVGKSVLVNSKVCEREFVEDSENDLVFDEFGTFSVIYGIPQSEWNLESEEIELDVEEEEDEEADEEERKLEDLVEIGEEDFQGLWEMEEVAEVDGDLDLGFELDVEEFCEALKAANVGVMAVGQVEEGEKIYGYGYFDGNIALIECLVMGGQMQFKIKAETEEVAEKFRDFWVGFFDE